MNRCHSQDGFLSDALICAATSGHIDIVCVLVGAGANKDVQVNVRLARVAVGCSVWHLSSYIELTQ